MDEPEQQKRKVGRPKGTPKTGGRAKGTPNKITGVLKDMVVQALNEAGGVKYLVRQAKENPGPFMTLVGRVIPLQVNGPDGGAIPVSLKVEFVGGKQ